MYETMSTSCRPIPRAAPPGVHHLLEVPALDIFAHQDEGGVPVDLRTEGIHIGGDPLVMQRPQDRRFPFEELDGFPVGDQPEVEELGDDGTTRPGVGRLVCRSRRAPAQLPEDFVAFPQQLSWYHQNSPRLFR